MITSINGLLFLRALSISLAVTFSADALTTLSLLIRGISANNAQPRTAVKTANPSNMVLTVLFYASLFLIGLQFGAVTLMPMIMTADAVDYYEHKTGKS